MLDQTIKDFMETREFLSLYGRQTLQALFILILGLIAIPYIKKGIRYLLARFGVKQRICGTVANVIGILLFLFTILLSTQIAGMDSANVNMVLKGAALVAIAAIFIFRPYLPSLPFKVGNVVKTGGLLGKVEATTVLNTRIKTFDGKTVFVPNRLILNDYLINYHYTPTRRVKIDVSIRYDQDLMKAKQILEATMIKDARVKVTPRPAVYVLNLKNGCIELGGRCWVPNPKYWLCKCELLEKTKLVFDSEGIIFARPQLDVYKHDEPDALDDTPEGEALAEPDEIIVS